MDLDIDDAVSKVKQGRFLKFLIGNEHYQEMVGPEMTSRFLGKGHHLVYITSNKPSLLLQKGLAGKNRDSVYFIDMVSGSGSVLSRKKGNIHFMPSPKSLTELGISIFTNEELSGRRKLVLLDSIPSLIEKNGEEEVLNFIRFLSHRVENTSDSGVLISVTDENFRDENSFAGKHVNETISIRKTS